MCCKTRENPGTVLLLKPPIQGRDGEDKREEVEGRWSTEALCVRPATDAGAAADSPAAPRCPFLRGRRRWTPGAPGSAFTLIYCCCYSVWCSCFDPIELDLEVAGLCGFSKV